MAEVRRYGCTWRTDDPFKIELECIRRGGNWEVNGKKCGMGLPFHVRMFQSCIWPWKQWTRWNKDLILPELCKGGRVALFGPSSSWKTFECACFVLTMFWARPKGTTVLCSTTTIDALNFRVFGEIKKLFRLAKERAPWLPGFMLDSDQMILADEKGSEGGREFRDGIVGVACKKGNEWQSLSEYVGIKNDVIYVVADECHLMQLGFWNGMANLLSNDKASIFAVGNLNDLMSPLGKAAEPKLGWDSLPDTEKSRVYETRWYGGRAIQLCGKDSPNLDYPEGQEPFPKLIGRRYLQQIAHDYGEGTIFYDMFASGKIPRSTMTRRVITRSQCIKFNAFDTVEWGHEPIKKLYSLDAAYSAIGGDRTAGAPWGFGVDVTGKMRLGMLERPKIYTGSPDEKMSHEDFIALQVKSECERLGIEPHEFFYDGTGRSSLTSSLARLWSPNVVPIEFGGKASERPNFQGLKYPEGEQRGELKPCREIFGKFVTELWFATAVLIVSDQARGLSEDLVEEGCLRLWKEIPGNKVDVEPKRGTPTNPGMIERVGRSPDLYDMFACAVEGARRLGFPLGKLADLAPRNVQRSSAWLGKMRREHLDRIKKYELKST